MDARTRLGWVELYQEIARLPRARARRLKVVWSSTGRARPSRPTTEPISLGLAVGKTEHGPKREGRQDG